MPQVERLDLPRPMAMARPVVPLVLRAERLGWRSPLASLALRGDSVPRLLLGVDASDRATIEFGPGGAAARDVRFSRATAGEAQIDANSAAVNTLLRLQATAAQRVVLDLAIAGEALTRARLSGDATLTGLEFGSGALARDVRLYRSAAGALVVDSNGAAATSQIAASATAGQRAVLSATVTGDASARAALWGDATITGLELGPGSAARDLRAYRSAAKVLTVDDNAGAAATLNVIGALQQGGVGVNRPRNASTADQAIAAATLAYLTGSSIAVPVGLLRVGTVFRWRLHVSKSAAATVAGLAFHVRIGTAGTTADAAVLTFTQAQLQTAVVDDGVIDISVVIRGPLGAACIAQGSYSLGHNGDAAGLAVVPVVAIKVLSGGFNSNTANLIVGLSCTTTASQVLTFQQIVTDVINLPH